MTAPIASSLTAPAIQLVKAIQNNSTLEVMTKEIAGINAPKVIFTRSNDERMDVLVNEFGNTVGFFGGGVLLDPLMTQVFKKFTHTAEGKLKEGILNNHWVGLGKSFAIYSILGAFMWAMPFVRNYITGMRTGTVDYTEVIGNKAHAHKTNDAQTVKKRIQHYGLMALAILGVGLGGALGSVAIANTALSRGWSLAALEASKLPGLFKNPLAAFGKWATNPAHKIPGFGENLTEALTFKDHKFAKGFKDLPALLFWGATAYGGWIHASRDNYEKKEQILKFANFVFCFFVIPRIVSKLFPTNVLAKVGQLVTNKQLPRELFDSIQPLLKGNKVAPATLKAIVAKLPEESAKLVSNVIEQANFKQYFTSLGASIVALGIFPTLLNIYLTKQRIARAQSHQHIDQRPSIPFSTGQSQTPWLARYPQWGSTIPTRSIEGWMSLRYDRMTQRTQESV